MTEAELRKLYEEFNNKYFKGALKCDLVVTEDWIDDQGNYYAESQLTGGNGFDSGTVGNVKVQRAPALYNHSEDRIRFPKWKMVGQAARGVLLHEMAHSAANEPEIDHGPKWHGEMKKLRKLQAPINMQDVTPGHSAHELVTKYGVGSEFWES